MGRFIQVCRRRGLIVSTGKVMVLGGVEDLECEVCIDGIRLKHVSEFKYLRCVLVISGTDEAEGSRKVASGRRIAGAIRFVINARSLKLECVRILYESLLVPILTYGRETKIWREKEKYRIRAVQMDNLKGLLGIRRVDKVSNARIRQFCGDTKRVDERIDEGVLRWFGHVERMENDGIAKRVYVG